MNNLYLGFDTSNYTTSTAAVFDGGCINNRQILEVKSGQRGLRQSDALFLHIKNMPELYSSLCGKVNIEKARAVGVSTRPRNAEGSYMPVFLAGIMQARAVSDTLGIPLLEFSHQDGHIMAAVHSSDSKLLNEPFLSVHISGGTTEILKTEYNGYNFNCEIVGATMDISAGQVIDRVGVAAGMRFPCGAELDELSKKSTVNIKLPVNARDGFFNLSGLETKAVKMLETQKAEDVAMGVLQAISETMIKSLRFCSKSTGLKKILIAGGVASNSTIRRELQNKLDAKVYFASHELSCDNAVGIALCAREANK